MLPAIVERWRDLTEVQVTDIEGRPPAPPGATTDEQDYQAATSGEGLEMIGGRTGWWEKAWDEQFQFKGYASLSPAFFTMNDSLTQD